MQTQIKTVYAKSNPKERFYQGDILKDVSIIIQTGIDDTGEIVISEINLEYAIILSQDCDLEQDYNNKSDVNSKNQDKVLPSILILPAYLATKIREGIHRGEDFKVEAINSKIWSQISSNSHSRYHFIKANEEFQIPDLVVDFKHFYTINRDVAYRILSTVYFVTISELYRENLSQRYGNYLSRIGLPS